jgi:hypothetical protein
MRDLIVSIFGTYTPVIDPVSGSVPAGFAGVDWPYVAGVFLFALVLYGLLRFLGVMFKR